MVGADDAAALAAGAVQQPRRAMQADIVEGPRNPVLAAHHDDAFADEVEAVIVAGVRNVVQMADHLPGRRQHLVLLGFEKAGVGIDPARKATVFVGVGVGHGELLFGIEAGAI